MDMLKSFQSPFNFYEHIAIEMRKKEAFLYLYEILNCMLLKLLEGKPIK